MLTATDAVGSVAGIPVVAPSRQRRQQQSRSARRALEAVARRASARRRLPQYASDTAAQAARAPAGRDPRPQPAGRTSGKIALFATCYVQPQRAGIGRGPVAVYEHNGIPVDDGAAEKCCGMPKLELGDLEAVRRAEGEQHPAAARKLVDQG